MSKRNAMTALTRWVLRHKRLVVGLWLVARDRRLRGDEAGRRRALDSSSTSPAARRSTPTAASPRSTATAATSHRSCPVVTLPQGTTVDSPGVAGELERGARQGPGRAAGRARRLLRLDARPGLRLRGRPHDLRARLHPGEGRGRPRPGRGPRGPGRARRRHRRRIARPRSPGSTRCAPPPPTAARAAARAWPSRRWSRASARCSSSRFVFALVHGDRAAADGARRDPDDLPAGLAAGDRHRRLGHRQVPRRAGRPRRSRSTTRCWSSCAGARSASAAARPTRTPSSQRDAARRPGRRLQRHDRRHLAARARRPARAVPAQHRHRRHADPARQRRRRDHAAAGRPGDHRPEARLAAHARRDGPRRAAAGRPGRASSCATAGPPPSASTAVLGALVVAASSIQLGNPRADSLAQAGPGARRPRPARATPASAPARSRRSTRSSARAIPTAVAHALADVDGVRSAVAPADWRRDGTALVTVIPTQDGNSPAGRATLDRVRAADRTCRPTSSTGGEAAQSADFLDAVYGNFPLVIALICRADVPAARARVPLADPAAQGRPAEPALGRAPRGG